MSEYTEVERPFLQHLQTLGWEIIDQGREIPSDPTRSLRASFRQWLLPEVFNQAVAALNPGQSGNTWLTAKQLADLQEQILRQPNRTLLEANEAVQKLLFKAQVDVNEETGERDPVVRLIDFETPENNHFLAINQFRIDTTRRRSPVHHHRPGAVRKRHSAGGGGVQKRRADLRQPHGRGFRPAPALYEPARGYCPAGPEGRRAAAVSQQFVRGSHDRGRGRLRHDHFRRGALLPLENPVAP